METKDSSLLKHVGWICATIMKYLRQTNLYKVKRFTSFPVLDAKNQDQAAF